MSSSKQLSHARDENDIVQRSNAFKPWQIRHRCWRWASAKVHLKTGKSPSNHGRLTSNMQTYRRGCKLDAQNAALAKKFKCAGEKPEIPHFFWLTLLRFSPATNCTVASNGLSCWPGPVSRASELVAPRPTSFDMPLVRPTLPPGV